MGIRGFTADYYYDYTCMETLQGLSASELSSADGRRWRTTHSDPDHTVKEGLDNTVGRRLLNGWSGLSGDTGLNRDDLDLNYDNVVELFKSGKFAMYFGSSSGVKCFGSGHSHNISAILSREWRKWLMTTPYFQVALNRDLAQDETRRKKAMKVLIQCFQRMLRTRSMMVRSLLQPGCGYPSYRISERCETCDRRKSHVYPYCVK